MKKKHSSTTVDIADIKTLIHDHATFFHNLVDLIPARFYLSTDNLDKPWTQGLPKKVKQAAKLLSIENTKKSRRDRLDPEKAVSKTTNEILKESLESEKSENQSENTAVRSSVTIEELKLRLHKRIEELRSCRGGVGGGAGGGNSERKEKREAFKRKRNEELANKEIEKDKKKEREVIENQVSKASEDIEFGKVKLRADNDDGSLNKKKKRKLSKEEELKRAIQLEEAKKDPEKGEMVAKKHSWKAATERAMGIKVHDNPKLLKQSLQKDKKKHNKSVEKWKQRSETTHKMKKDKQVKRKDNIKAKIDRKKQTKIDKREKKLMRPGFEGRKEGFANGN